MTRIKQLAKTIAEHFHPEKIILFGSYAAGRATKDSDVDLLIILNHKTRDIDKAVEVRMSITPSFPVDILIKTPQKVKQRLAIDDPFIKTIFSQGKVLYEANN
ncbi:MAG: nucleotidyltransferase domain-containing protein [Planctomycetota bacterium]